MPPTQEVIKIEFNVYVVKKNAHPVPDYGVRIYCFSREIHAGSKDLIRTVHSRGSQPPVLDPALSGATSMQFIPSKRISLRCVLVLSSSPFLGLARHTK
jgi:hypothetical protein